MEKREVSKGDGIGVVTGDRLLGVAARRELVEMIKMMRINVKSTLILHLKEIRTTAKRVAKEKMSKSYPNWLFFFVIFSVFVICIPTPSVQELMWKRCTVGEDGKTSNEICSLNVFMGQRVFIDCGPTPVNLQPPAIFDYSIFCNSPLESADSECMDINESAFDKPWKSTGSVEEGVITVVATSSRKSFFMDPAEIYGRCTSGTTQQVMFFKVTVQPMRMLLPVSRVCSYRHHSKTSPVSPCQTFSFEGEETRIICGSKDGNTRDSHMRFVIDNTGNNEREGKWIETRFYPRDVVEDSGSFCKSNLEYRTRCKNTNPSTVAPSLSESTDSTASISSTASFSSTSLLSSSSSSPTWSPSSSDSGLSTSTSEDCSPVKCSPAVAADDYTEKWQDAVEGIKIEKEPSGISILQPSKSPEKTFRKAFFACYGMSQKGILEFFFVRTTFFGFERPGQLAFDLPNSSKFPAKSKTGNVYICNSGECEFQPVIGDTIIMNCTDATYKSPTNLTKKFDSEFCTVPVGPSNKHGAPKSSSDNLKFHESEVEAQDNQQHHHQGLRFSNSRFDGGDQHHMTRRCPEGCSQKWFTLGDPIVDFHGGLSGMTLTAEKQVKKETHIYAYCSFDFVRLFERVKHYAILKAVLMPPLEASAGGGSDESSDLASLLNHKMFVFFVSSFFTFFSIVFTYE